MATRQTQPYRQSGARAPSPVLDRMLAGRGPLPKPGAGATLVQAMSKPTRQVKKQPLKIPLGRPRKAQLSGPISGLGRQVTGASTSTSRVGY